MSIKKAAGVAVLRIEPSSTKAPDAFPAAKTTGWDPYEVWRTRVLIPRLQDKTAAELADTSTKLPLLRSI